MTFEDLSAYERRALEEVDAHRARQLARSPRRLVPRAVKDAAGAAGEHAKRVPGATKAVDAYKAAAGGAAKALGKAGEATVSPERVLSTFRRRGHVLETLREVRTLDLQAVEAVRSRHVDKAYGAVAAAEGAVVGAVITGGQTLGTFGMGAGAAPGLGVVAGAVGADVAFTITLMNRAIAQTAMHYGYDPAEPAEAVFAMSVLSLGSAATSGAQLAAYRELSQLTQQLARRATWKQLNEHVLPRIATKFANQFGFRLTQRKLGTLVPVVGVLVGAGLNYALLDRVADAAYWAYRERFLREKSGVFSFDATDDESVAQAEMGDAGVVEVPIDMFQIVEEALAEEEGAAEAPDASDSSEDSTSDYSDDSPRDEDEERPGH